MGIFSTLTGIKDLGQLLAPSSRLASPFAEHANIHTISVADFPQAPTSRAEAMRVPAVVRARNLVCTTIARTPMAVDGVAPGWLTSATPVGAPAQSLFHRMLHTADDLLFYGVSLWALERGVSGAPTAAIHVPRHRWQIDADAIVIDGRLRPDMSELCVFQGIHDGVLQLCGDTFRDALNIARAASRVGATPAALIELRQTNDADISDAQIDAIISRYIAARRGENGGVSFSSTGIEVVEHDMAAENLLIDGRNAAAVDIARIFSVPAAFIDATVGGTSLSYSNAQSRMVELVTFGVEPLMSAIEARLSLDDMTDPGTSVNFDVAALLSTIPAIEKESSQ